LIQSETSTGEKLERKIIGFHQDEEEHWVADLDCGHGQHMRHDPPWMERPWVIDPEARKERIGTVLNCRKCDEELKIDNGSLRM
jgi:hypothetical protein